MFTAELYKKFLKHPKVVIDTRKDVDDAIFFALKGENFNGNLYAENALQKGAAFAVVDEDIPYNEGKKIIKVENCLQALTDLALFHREQMKIPVLAITGSNGKTTTKELIASVLSKKFKLLFTEGNFNNHIGVPLTLLRLNKMHDFAVIEMGANHQGEIAHLCYIAKPGFGVITNIGRAHLEGFGGYEGVVKAKSELYRYLMQNGGSVFVNNNNPLLNELSLKIPRVTYGAAPDADCHGKIKPADNFLNVVWESVKEEICIHSNLFGSYNFENIMAAVCIGNYFKVKQEEIKTAIEEYKPVNQRSQLIKSRKNTLVVDAYNANPTSMAAAITDFSKQKSANKILILGDMRELGVESKQEHSGILDLISDLGFENVYLIGPEFSSVNNNNNWKSFDDIDVFTAWLEKHPIQNKHILIKGSRGIKLEKCLPLL